MSTHSYVASCVICGGNAQVVENTRPPYTSQDCYDCGYWQSDQPGYEGSGFIDFGDINNLRELVDMEELTQEEFMAIRTKINVPYRLSVPDEYDCVINRKIQRVII